MFLYFLRIFEKKNKDPDPYPGGQLITDPQDPDPQHCFKHGSSTSQFILTDGYVPGSVVWTCREDFV